jgi:uncharacterized protein
MTNKTTTKHSALLAKLIQCSMKGDLEGAQSCIHPDNVFYEAVNVPYPGEFFGHAGFIRLLAAMNTAFEAKIDQYDMIDDGERLAVRMQLSLKSRISGRALRLPVVEMYSFTDDLISSVDVYYKDTKVLSDLAAGL